MRNCAEAYFLGRIYCDKRHKFFFFLFLERKLLLSFFIYIIVTFFLNLGYFCFFSCIKEQANRILNTRFYLNTIMQTKYLLSLMLLPVVYFICTAESCNCQVDPTDFTNLKAQVANYGQSGNVRATYTKSKSETALSFAKECKCIYASDDIDKEAAKHVGKDALNQDDRLALNGLAEVGKNPLNTLSALWDWGVVAAGVQGGRVGPPPPPPPPVIELKMGFSAGQTQTAIIGPDPALGMQGDYVNMLLTTMDNLNATSFDVLAPQDAFRDKLSSGQPFFATSRNGYNVMYVDMGDGKVMRLSSFNQARLNAVANVLVVE